MKLIFALLFCCGLLYTAAAQPPDSKEMEQQMKEMEQRLKEMEQRLRDMEREQTMSVRPVLPVPPTPPTPPAPRAPDQGRKVIIIDDGKRVDTMSLDFNFEGLDSLGIDADEIRAEVEREMEQMRIEMQDEFGDSAFRYYENDDSVVIRLGSLRVKVDEEGRRVERHTIVNKNDDGDDDDDDNDKKKKSIQGTALGLRLGLNNYLYGDRFKTPPAHPELELNTGKSVHVNLGLAGIKWRIEKDYVTLHTGVALDFINYRFGNDWLLRPKVDTVSFYQFSDGANVTKNKLAATYLELPLRIQFQTSNKESKAFRFSVGGRVGYRIGAHTKIVADGDKIKQRDDFNLTTLKYGLTGQIGFSYLNFYINYDLTPVFESGVQPELMPVAAGIVLTGW